MPLLTWWVLLQPFAWHWHENPIFFIGSAGALLLVLGESHGHASRYAIPYRLYGALLCMGVLSFLSFHQVQIKIARFDDVGKFFLQSALITVLSLMVFCVAFFLQMRREEMTLSYLQPLYGFAVRQWLPISMVLLMFLMTVWHAALGDRNLQRGAATVVIPTILANIAMLALAFWLMMVGLREDRVFPFGAGVVYFLQWAVMRYADLFGDFGGMLGASCMFFVCGAGLATFALYWHFRRQQLREAIREREVETEDDIEPSRERERPAGKRESGSKRHE